VRSIPKLAIYNKRSLGKNKPIELLLFLTAIINKFAGWRPKCLEIGRQNALAERVMSYAQCSQAEIFLLKRTSEQASNQNGFD
jgi:hypothetical protein